MSWMRQKGAGLAAASAVLLGTTPALGKLALEAGLAPLAVVAARTAGAAALLLLVVAIFRRRFLYIYPLGLAGCLLAGGLNGLGSLLYYTGLARLDAGLAQLLFSLYPVFVAVLLFLDGQRYTLLTLARLLLSLPAVVLLTRAAGAPVDAGAAALMVGAGALYALHIPINQRVLYEVPAPTVTLYTLVAMTAVVVPAWLIGGADLAGDWRAGAGPLLALTGVTFLSRLALFAGVKRIGGMQASLLGLAELLVAVFLAQLWLRESLSASQWAGAALLAVALLLAVFDPGATLARRGRGWLHWLTPPEGAVEPAAAGPGHTAAKAGGAERAP
jgi:drug/metabolite transporter (DMT)-like permease